MRLGLGGQSQKRSGRLEMDEFQRPKYLQLLDVFREIAAGEPEMDELAFGEIGEFLDPRLDVMERDPFALRDGREVDLPLDLLVVLDRLRRDRHPEIALALHDGDPEIALQGHAAVLRPDGFYGPRGIALGKDVGNGRGSGGGQLVHGRRWE